MDEHAPRDDQHRALSGGDAPIEGRKPIDQPKKPPTWGRGGETAAVRQAERSLHDDADVERDICIVRPSMFRAHPLRYSMVVLLFLGAVIVSIMAKAAPQHVAGGWFWPAIIVGLLVLGYWTWWWVDVHLSMKLRITSKRTIHRIGLFSRNTSEVLHRDIRNIRIDQNFFQRIFSVGRLRIDSAAGGGDTEIEIEMADVPKPHDLKSMIDRYRDL